jgi:AraC-like DNA-binding protein
MTDGVESFTYSTRDVAEAHESIRTIYVDHGVQFLGRGDRCTYDFRTLSAGGLSVDAMRYSVAVRVSLEPIDWVHLALSRGRMSLDTGPDGHRVRPGGVFLTPIGRPFVSSWVDLDVRIVRCPLSRVAQLAATRFGISPGDFRFDGVSPVSAVAENRLRATMTHVSHAFQGPDPAVAEPLLREALIDLVAAAALATFPNTATAAAYTASPGRVAPAAVRRAAQYVEDHADGPVTLPEVAAAAGVSARALQEGFARHLGTTPIGYLRRVRLDRAHRELQAADPARGDTVEAVARRWGFANPGRFAVRYREAFGRSPSETLRT